MIHIEKTQFFFVEELSKNIFNLYVGMLNEDLTPNLESLMLLKPYLNKDDINSTIQKIKNYNELKPKNIDNIFFVNNFDNVSNISFSENFKLKELENHKKKKFNEITSMDYFYKKFNKLFKPLSNINKIINEKLINLYIDEEKNNIFFMLENSVLLINIDDKGFNYYTLNKNNYSNKLNTKVQFGNKIYTNNTIHLFSEQGIRKETLFKYKVNFDLNNNQFEIDNELLKEVKSKYFTAFDENTKYLNISHTEKEIAFKQMVSLPKFIKDFSENNNDYKNNLSEFIENLFVIILYESESNNEKWFNEIPYKKIERIKELTTLLDSKKIFVNENNKLKNDFNLKMENQLNKY